MHAQTLHWVCPVSAGEFLSALTGEPEVVVPGGCPVFVDVPEGVLVEDVGEFSKRLENLGAEYYIDRNQQEPNTGYFEKKFYGPERVLFDIAEHPWAGCEPLPAEVKEAAE